MPTLAFLSHTVTKPFERYFKSRYEIVHYPLDTIMQTLHGDVPEDILVILVDSPFFFEEEVTQSAFEKVTLFKDALRDFRKRYHGKIVTNTVCSTFFSPYLPQGQASMVALTKLNAEITSLQEELFDCCVIDMFTLALVHGAQTFFSEKNSYLFQMPFSKNGMDALAYEIDQALLLLTQPRIKAIAVDADNTLWGGIVGEDGVENLQCDQNYPGIIYKKFQHRLIKLKESGVVLILLSKNNERDVQDVFEKKEMPLRLHDFIATAVNWKSKSENLASLLETLRLTKEGVIFLDDSETEILEMESRLGIRCYKMNPSHPLENLHVLASIPLLKGLKLSNEDRVKTELYHQERERKESQTALSSKDDFIKSLGIVIDIYKNHLPHCERATQLVNKTNQFNLTAQRYTQPEIEKFMQEGEVYTINVKDRFGDMGLVGVVIVVQGEIKNFLLSCRVLGREIENSIISFVASCYGTLRASYCPTEKNNLVKDFYEKNGFHLVSQGETKVYELLSALPYHESIKVNRCL